MNKPSAPGYRNVEATADSKTRRRSNRCDTCRLLAVTVCPLRDKAFSRYGWSGLEQCAQADAIDKLLERTEDGFKIKYGRNK